LISENLRGNKMGGFNSGRHGGKRTTSDMRPLDVRVLKRAKRLTPGKTFAWSWTRFDETVARINVHVDTKRVVLNYRQSWRGGEWRDCCNTVYLDWTPCHYGGQRVWWRCPAVGCGRRVAVLYSGKDAYACRHCLGLGYRSQRETETDLAARRANRVRDRLGWARGILHLPGGRPKGMHWETYARLLTEHTEHLNAALGGFGRQLGALQDRLRRLR
jgi:hypothetical protein